MRLIRINGLGFGCLWGLLVIGLGCTGCTSGRSGSAGQVKASQTAGIATTSKSVAGGLVTEACTTEDFAPFEHTDGEVVDLDRESLPRGLFLATLAEMAIEKKTEGSSVPARLIVREVSGGKGAEINCADGIERLGSDFEMALTGLVKFETTQKPEGSGFTSRQFFFFQDKDGYGVVLSNPKHLIGSLSRQQPVDLRQILRASPASPQLLRVNDRSYLLKYTRERDGVRGYLLIHLALY
jgi:hypothetical protein